MTAPRAVAAAFGARPAAPIPSAATNDPRTAVPGCACLTANQLARMLGVNRKTVYEYAAKRVIPSRRVGRRVLFPKDAIAAWLFPAPSATRTA